MKRIVIKIGSSSLVKKDGGLDSSRMDKLVKVIADLKNGGNEVCLVSSGAVAAGFTKLGLNKKPVDIVKKQACAAVGQMQLMQQYEEFFDNYGINCAQVLVNHDDFGNRKRSLGLLGTMNALFKFGVVPIVNENDALAADEIKVGDNDTLSAMMALIVNAELLVLVTDVDGLFSSNPAIDKNAELIRTVEKIDSDILRLGGDAVSKVGTGGMATKLKAAQIVTGAGIDLLIIKNDRLSELSKATFESCYGTFFSARKQLRSVKQSWLLFCADIAGRVIVDDGAKQAVLARKSLLSCGVKKIEGDFMSGEVVELCGADGVVFAKGTANLTSAYFENGGSRKSKLLLHANNIALTEDK